jgi:hypothetical protein
MPREQREESTALLGRTRRVDLREAQLRPQSRRTRRRQRSSARPLCPDLRQSHSASKRAKAACFTR